VSNLDMILRLFPDAQIVTIVRDGRDCVASLKEMPWHRADIYDTVAAWARAYDDGRRAARRLDPGSYHEVRYEDLVREPEPVLTALCRYVGEEYDPAMVRPSEVAAVAVPARKTWHARTRSAVTTQRVGSWRQRLEPWEIALCETALGGRLTAAGYELSGTPTPAVAHRVRYGLAAARHRLAPAKRGIERGVGRLRPAPPVADRGA
jgi:hypothetical protein